MTDRIAELLELASAGDEDVALQVESEFALMADTKAQLIERAIAVADAMSDEYAPPAKALEKTQVDALEEEAGF